MNYFKNTNNEIFAYDDSQVAQGFGKDMDTITEDKMKSLTAYKPTNEDIIAEKYAQIAELEAQLIRPMRELLSSITSDEAQIYAQSKIDSIETQIQGLRDEIKALSSTI